MTEAHGYDADLLILGGSFLGVELLRLLRGHRRGRKLSVIVIDRQVTHPYIPLGHELLTQRMTYAVAGDTELETQRYAVATPGVRWIEGELVGFDAEAHEARLADGRSFSARFVVFGVGSEIRAPASLPGGARMLAYKSKAQFEQCRAALQQVMVGEGEPPCVLVVGGGISGVEIAGELAHLAKSRPANWRAPKLVMVHGGDRLLAGLTPRAGKKAEAALRAQGVELLLETRLVSVSEETAMIRGPEGERTIPCALGFWAGGLQPPPVIATIDLPHTEDGWLRVGPTLQCVSDSTASPELFAGGDVARVYGGDGRWPTMQRAIEAIFAAKTIAANILTLARHPVDYPGGVPPLEPHPLWSDFPHGVSIGGRSLMVYGPLVLPLAGFNIWFRRFLMRMYMRRYRA
ncbi:NADH dehydrogenase [Enhygromyxa salina]|uniref:NADH dehydrogenase n=1 Tax=Enhygromyxa salina TaxID=215803 RepID=A0A0C2DB87_9BACT|nr:FAD-dependent oxidoreductase [Enhygromyxa salina]KIG17072.1 NADH dehydrogenase [Enhygromyxa salina]